MAITEPSRARNSHLWSAPVNTTTPPPATTAEHPSRHDAVPHCVPVRRYSLPCRPLPGVPRPGVCGCPQARVRFEVVYRWPGGEASLVSWPSMTATVEDDQQMLVDIEQNIANLERSFCDRSSFGGSPTHGTAADPASPTPSRKR